jgi:hypothetical protein
MLERWRNRKEMGRAETLAGELLPSEAADSSELSEIEKARRDIMLACLEALKQPRTEEDRRPRIEDRRQESEDRGRKTEDRGRKTEDRRQKVGGRDSGFSVGGGGA